jgi:acyl-CoA thioester hydrolase
MGSWHEQRLRVCYEETDAVGVVCCPKYLVLMEAGRVGLLHDVGFGHSERVRREIQFPIVHTPADYRSQARFDDGALDEAMMVSIRNRSIRSENKICKLPDTKFMATGHTVMSRGRSTSPFSAEPKAMLTSS